MLSLKGLDIFRVLYRGISSNIDNGDMALSLLISDNISGYHQHLAYHIIDHGNNLIFLPSSSLQVLSPLVASLVHTVVNQLCFCVKGMRSASKWVPPIKSVHHYDNQKLILS